MPSSRPTSSARLRQAALLTGAMLAVATMAVTSPIAGAGAPPAAIPEAPRRPHPGASQGQSASVDWPQILGPERNGTAAHGVAPWSSEGPPTRWRRDVGEGFAGPTVVGNVLVLFHRVGDQERVAGVDVRTGDSIWSTAYPTSYRDDFGFDEGPRATPTISGDRVFTFGAEGVLQAVRLADGELLWRVQTHKRFAVRKGFFGAAGSPLVHGELVMVNVGSRDGAGIVAFDVDTGEVMWTATDDEASYAAPTMAELGGRATALFFTRAGLVALDPDRGAVRARFPWRSRIGASVNAATPLFIDGRIFISASYGTGAALLDFTGEAFAPVWTSDDALTNHYATSVHTDGVLYGYHGRQEYRPALRAVYLESGEVAWSRERFGGGTLLLAGDRLLILTERGELILAEASADAFLPLARAQILDGTVRAYPALAAGTLYARNERELVAVELGRY